MYITETQAYRTNAWTIIMLSINKSTFRKKHEMFVNHGCPPKLKCHCHLDLWPGNTKFNRGHLPVMTNHHIKLEDSQSMSSLVIDQTRFVYGPTERPTIRRTDMCKSIYPLFLEGGHNKEYIMLNDWSLFE